MSLNIQTATGLLEIGGSVTKLNVFTSTVQKENIKNIKEANNSE